MSHIQANYATAKVLEDDLKRRVDRGEISAFIATFAIHAADRIEMPEAHDSKEWVIRLMLYEDTTSSLVHVHAMQVG